MDKNISHSDDVRDAASDEESYTDFAMRLAKTFNWSSSSSQHIRTMDSKVTSRYRLHESIETI